MTVIGGCDMYMTLEKLDYRCAMEIDWEEMSLTFPFVSYEFMTGTMAGNQDGGPYDGHWIDGLRSCRIRRGFPAVEVV